MIQKNFLLLVVAVTMFIACDNGTGKSDSNAEKIERKITEGSLNIVFIDLDTLLAKYDLYNESKETLEAQAGVAEKEIGKKLESFQKRVETFQKEVMQIQQNADNIAPIELQKLSDKYAKQQKALESEEQSLLKQRDEAARALEKNLADLQADLKKSIDDYLEKIAEERGYDFILSKGSVGGVLYGSNALDITQEAVEAINKEYATRKK